MKDATPIATDTAASPPKLRGRAINVYLSGEMLAELDAHAARLDRSRRWLLRRAWKLAKATIEAMPDNDPDGGDDAE